MSAAIDDVRQFALLAIDDARGETCAWTERCTAAEAQCREQVSLSVGKALRSPPALERKPT